MACRIGDLYMVDLGNGQMRVFHHLLNDFTQLGGNVVRIFKAPIPISDKIDLSSIVSSEVDFHAHTFCAVGVKLGLWKKIGHSKAGAPVTTWFRDSLDYGKPDVKVSQDWVVWRVNEARKHIGPLEGQYINADIGVIFSPITLHKRLTDREYQFAYPGFE
ncbi:hypothetical protein JY96_21725 [Aquabacterium sp. NJ1]|uniref:hypothetical protein n=1 Tax=Aquabacterium sp. NJ1 TaxID=1538295 RepID=UPI00052BC6EE|nr:hypothetical protein [Aquabacterium sp. NJ1]KGM38546.1 hypothetical protein JY96_21725 [Aquabacterium sp. NJ1]